MQVVNVDCIDVAPYTDAKVGSFSIFVDLYLASKGLLRIKYDQTLGLK